MSRILVISRHGDAEVEAGHILNRLVELFGQQAVLQNPDGRVPRPDAPQVAEGMLFQMAIAAMVVVIGPRWADATDAGGQPALADPFDGVRLQIGAALRRGLPLIPVLVGGAQLPPPRVLPPDVQPLLTRNGIQVRAGRDFERDMQRLSRALSRWVPPLPLPLDEARRRSLSATLRWGVIFGALVAVVGLANNTLMVALADALHADARDPVTVSGIAALVIDLALFFFAGYAKVRSLGAWAAGTTTGLLAGMIGGLAGAISLIVTLPIYNVAAQGPSGQTLGVIVGVIGALFFLLVDVAAGAALGALGGSLARRLFARPAPPTLAPVATGYPPTGYPPPGYGRPAPPAPRR
jgi:hypothetical protein